jgi:hypothetical protein|tara:strand:- start:3186 stop:3452 length:267 start_codon:yes stop_codon:yes gene_type:complete
MCSFGGGPSLPPPPPPPDPAIEEEAKARRARIRREEFAEARRLKEESYEDRVASVYGKRGRRTLLTSRKGGEGFEIDRGLLSKTDLGV